MKTLSAEQQTIVDAPLRPLSVVACAGSGKTRTAVSRLIEIRRRLAATRSHVALLSFSNVAVDTFQKDYDALARGLSEIGGQARIAIETADSFITTNILRPHAYRTMGAPKAAFLVTGSESFLAGFKIRTENFPLDISELRVGIRAGTPYFYLDHFGNKTELETRYAEGIVSRLAKTGAYTHNLGRYWAYRTLQEQPGILRALARRYPHILVDEAQDIGALHRALLELLSDAGVQISLIGDPHQAIYEFSGSDGSFLQGYGSKPQVLSFELTQNYRSVPLIVDVAASVSKRKYSAVRAAPDTLHGAYFVPYPSNDANRLVDAFHDAVQSASLDVCRSAILCRGSDLVTNLRGTPNAVGTGLVKSFVTATLLRDQQADFMGAFKLVAGCIVSLLDNPPQSLFTQLMNPGRDPELQPIRRRLWTFTRDATSGLPSANLVAKTAWHQCLLTRVQELLSWLETKFRMKTLDNLNQRLSRRGLPDSSLVAAAAQPKQRARIRIDTVHQAKGESLDAVLYIATRPHVQALLDGVDTEIGRIGYVAVTRARNLFWLGIPEACTKEFRERLTVLGLQERHLAASAVCGSLFAGLE